MYDLIKLADNIWIVDGSKVRDMGIWFTTRMVVVKLNNGSLWINSPVHVPINTFERIVELGPIKYLVAATPRHIWRLDQWNSLLPNTELWVTPQIRNKCKMTMVLPKRKLRFDGILDDNSPSAWKDDIEQIVFEGSYFIKEVIFYHKSSRTVIMDDLIQSHQFVKGKLLHNTLIRVGGVRPPGGVARDIRLTFTNRKLARQSLKRLLSWEFDKMVIAHGPYIEQGAKTLVERAFYWLK